MLKTTAAKNDAAIISFDITEDTTGDKIPDHRYTFTVDPAASEIVEQIEAAFDDAIDKGSDCLLAMDRSLAFVFKRMLALSDVTIDCNEAAFPAGRGCARAHLKFGTAASNLVFPITNICSSGGTSVDRQSLQHGPARNATEVPGSPNMHL